MKKDEKGSAIFRQIINETPQEIKTQIDWQYRLSEIISRRMEEMGMSKQELAKKIGTSVATVTQMIGGGKNFNLSTLSKLSAVLNLPLITICK